MDTKAQSCVRHLLETVPLIMRAIRAHAANSRGNLSLPQFRTLTHLRHTQGVSLSSLAKHHGLSLPAASRLIQRLVKRGLVVREEVSENRRQICLSLTDAGLTELERVRDIIRKNLAADLHDVPDEKLDEICRAAETLQKAFENARKQRDAQK